MTRRCLPPIRGNCNCMRNGSSVSAVVPKAVEWAWDVQLELVEDEAWPKTGFVDKNGKEVIPCEYDEAAYGEGYFALIKDEYLTILDKNLNRVF